MLYRAIHDPIPPPEEDLDTPEMAGAAVEVGRGERLLRVLAEVTEMTTRVARAMADLAELRIVEAKKEGGLKPGEDPGAPLNKMAQTIRRTVALEAKLAEGVEARRAGLVVERARRRADNAETHKTAKDEAILEGLHDAYAGSASPTDYEDMVEIVMEDAEEYLGDADELRGYLDRPAGEAVAKLCAALGLDPEACALDGETWIVHRPPTEFERTRDKLREKRGVLPPYPSPSGEGGFEPLREDGWGMATPHNVVASSGSPP